MVSAGVLGAVLTVALTSSSFELEGGSPPVAAAVPETNFQPSPTTTATVPQVSPTPEPRSVVYYFVDSQEKIDELQHALHRDLVDEALVNYKPLHNVTRIFILIQDHRDEGDALELLRQRPNDGTIVRAVDLR